MSNLPTKTNYLLIFIFVTTIIFGAAYADSESESIFLDMATDHIDEETAIKLAMLVSYHKEYADASGLNNRVFPFTNRAFVDCIDLQTLDGEKKYYAISLSRSKFEAQKEGELSEGLSEWLDFAGGRIKKTEEGKYEIDTSDWDFLQSWLMIYDNWNNYRGFYNCIVPASKSDVFLFGFHKGLSNYTYLGELAKRAIVIDTGASYDEVTLIYAAPSKDFLFNVKGEKYIVRFPEVMSGIPIEILSGEAVDDFLSDYKPGDEINLISDMDTAAADENIEDWLKYVDIVESRGGFTPSGTIYRIINETLVENEVPALSDGKEEPDGNVRDPTDARMNE